MVKPLKQINLAFIGAGHIATSVIVGLINDGLPPARIWATRRNADALNWLSEQLGVSVTTDNAQAAQNADVIVLAVKPVDMPDAASSVAEVVRNKQMLVLSLAAGVRCEQLQGWLGDEAHLVRCMPNTPALIQSAATGLYATNKVQSAECELAESIMRSIGLTVWLSKESDMDVVTALSGSGPAYFFRMMEALQRAGEALGLDSATARLLTLQTAFGAAGMALGSDKDLATLRAQVTSPGGTTAAGLEVLEKGEIDATFLRVLEAARDRAKSLSDEL